MARIILVLATCCLLGIPDGAARAQWRDELAVFRVGIATDGRVADASAAAEPFRLALEEALDVPVEMFAARDYTSLVDAIVDSRIEYSILSATAFSAAWNLCECIQPLAVAASADGATAFRNIIVVRAGGPSNVEGLRNRMLAVVDNGPVGGNLLALGELGGAGLIGGANPITVKRFADSGSALDALRAGEVVGYLGWEPVLENPASSGRGTLSYLRAVDGGAVYRTIWRSAEIPHRVHAMRSNLPAEAKTILRSLLTGLLDSDPVAYDSIEPIHGGGFVSARQSQFAALKAALARKGVEASRPGRVQSPDQAGPAE